MFTRVRGFDPSLLVPLKLIVFFEKTGASDEICWTMLDSFPPLQRLTLGFSLGYQLGPTPMWYFPRLCSSTPIFY